MKKTVFLLAVAGVAALLIWLLAGKQASDDEPRVAAAESLRITPSGSVVGYADKYDSYAWLGLPFAQPPVDDLRWRAPRPAETWAGTREALEFSTPCVQFGNPTAGLAEENEGEVVGSEDCLYLNIWAPRHALEELPAGNAGLPVMVWIHGGGNVIGTANTYRGHHLAGKHNALVVTVNYRLGILGWLSHPALRASAIQPEDGSGNYAILDLLAALRWVHSHIAAFGGDAKNVTVFGESVGGFNVFSLLGSPLAKGLFQRAIVQSGSMLTIPVAQAENFRDDAVPGNALSSRELINKLAIEDALADSRETAKAWQAQYGENDMARYLRDKPVQALFAPIEPMDYGMYLAPQSFRDGRVLPADSLLTVFSDPGRYNAVPVILGSNRDEYKSFMARDTELVDLLFGVLPRIKDLETYNRITAYYSDQWKALAVDEPAKVLQQSQGESVFAYRFDWDEAPANFLADLTNLVGAGHGLEVSFVFGDFVDGISIPQIYTAANANGRETLSAAMMSYWAQFAATGNPRRGSSGTLPEWKPWDPNGEKFIVLDSPAESAIGMSAETMTVDRLKERLRNDSEIESQRQRCELYAKLFLASFQTADFWDPQEYATLGDGGCDAYPPLAFLDW